MDQIAATINYDRKQEESVQKCQFNGYIDF